MSIFSSSKNRTLEPTIHIIAWILLFFFPLQFFVRQGTQIQWGEYLLHCVVPFCFCIVFYINYCILVPKLWLKNKKNNYIIANLILVGCASILLFFYLNIIPKPDKPGPRIIDMRWIFCLRDTILMGATVALAAAIRMSQQWSKAETARQKAEQSRAEAELKNLRNQLNPHFLLNTLNNIYALIAFNSDKAQDAVQELSKLLRHVLYDNQQNYVLLSKEADFIQNYIELMRIRLSDSIKVDTVFDIKENSQTQIAPLIFISLIENAFKHGISPTEPSFISISICENDEGEVICNIQNSNFPKNGEDRSGSGIGLEQVNRRLELLYPNAYKWEKGTSPDGLTYHSIITLQTKRNNLKS